MKKYVWWALVGIGAVAFFGRHDMRGVRTVDPLAWEQPRQTAVSDARPINFSRDGFEYKVTPLYEYDIAGVVAGVTDYRWFALNKTANAFPLDVCLVWGSNVRTGVFRDPRVSYSQDCRWCYVRWSGSGISFDLHEMANVHLVIDDAQVFSRAKSLAKGDQVRLRGKLVSVKIRQKSDGRESIWNSSTTRTDSGNGACEVMYVESVDVLRRANPAARAAFKAALAGLLVMTVWAVVSFFLPRREQ
jgi:hypothetical protein